MTSKEFHPYVHHIDLASSKVVRLLHSFYFDDIFTIKTCGLRELVTSLIRHCSFAGCRTFVESNFSTLGRPAYFYRSNA
jgi:hypothetical protein